jgi:putative ABC transport system permease protein
VGTTAEYARTVSSVDMLHGRFLAAQDEGRAAGVCVIDEQLSVKAFGRSDSVGESIHASTSQGARDLVVVGVYKVEGLEAMFTSQSTVYLPITAQLAMFHQETVDYVGVSVDAEAGLDRTAQELVAMLGIKHRNREAYSAENVMSQMETINTVMTGITAFVSLVALVSLVVGGIGVMNIMLITVTERTKEIGIRKALGATDGNIRLQFLVESVVLTALGGLAGVLLGYYGGFAVSGMIPQVQITPEVSPTMIGVSVAVSSLIGVIFGVYPASKAASLNPIDALRSE